MLLLCVVFGFVLTLSTFSVLFIGANLITNKSPTNLNAFMDFVGVQQQQYKAKVTLKL